MLGKREIFTLKAWRSFEEKATLKNMLDKIERP